MEEEPSGTSEKIIKPLPLATCSSLRSAVIVFGLAKVVEELVFNSLDARATKLFVYVGVGSFCLKVIDNGSGITRDGLALIGERYATSKIQNWDDKEDDCSKIFGFRGESLCSISDVSLLEVSTKAQGRPNGYRKVIKRRKCLYLGIDGEKQDIGTTVTVRDLFYNHPVRRKQMQSCPRKVLHSVKKCVLRIALACPIVSFKLVDLEGEDELLTLHPTSSPLQLLGSHFGFDVSNSLHRVCFCDRSLRFSGYVAHPWRLYSKGFQYVYVNSRFIRKGPIHKLMHQLAEGYCAFGGRKSKLGTRRNGMGQGALIYILNLHCPQSYYDITFEPLKPSVEFNDWEFILKFISEGIKHHWDSRLLDRDLSAQMSEASKDIKEDRKSNQVTSELKNSEQGHAIERCQESFDHHFLPQEVQGDGFDLISQKVDPTRSQGIGSGDGRKVESERSLVGFEASGSMLILQRNAIISHQNDLRSNGVLFSDSEADLVEPEQLTQKIISQPRSNLFFNQVADIWSPQNDITYSPLENFDLLHEFNEVTELGKKSSIRKCSSRGKFSYSQFVYLMDEELGYGIENPQTKRQRLDMDNTIDLTINGRDNSIFPWEHHSSEFCPFSEIKPKYASDLSCQEFFGNLQYDGNLRITDNKGNMPASCSLETDRHGNEDGVRAIFRGEIADKKLSISPCKSITIQNAYSPVRSCKYSETTNRVIEFNPSMDCNGNIEDFLPKHDPSAEGMHHYTELSTNFEVDDGKGDSTQQFFIPDYCHEEKTKRCHSAPPIYRGKKLFFTLASCSMVNPRKSNAPPAGVSILSTEHDSEKNNNVAKFTDGNRKKDLADCQNLVIHSDIMSKQDGDERSPSIKWRLDTSSPDFVINSRDKSCNINGREDVLSVYSGILHLCCDSLIPETVQKNCLEDAKVLQQVDKKFIPIVSRGILAVIDQHAADERIRLEELRHKVLSGEMKTTTYLDSEQELIIPEIGCQLLLAYANQINNWGWIMNVNHQQSKSFTKSLKLLHHQPTVIKLLAVPCVLGVDLTDKDLLEYLQQLSDTDGSSTMPPSVLRILNFKACRGAIMFGDSLLHSECALIVDELKRTSLCFQCAHGRPTTAPLVNLEAFRREMSKLELSNSQWHGLQKCPRSFDRAMRRLNIARGYSLY